jgi:hypothetical protein
MGISCEKRKETYGVIKTEDFLTLSLTEARSIDLDTVISYLLAKSVDIEYRFC